MVFGEESRLLEMSSSPLHVVSMNLEVELMNYVKACFFTFVYSKKNCSFARVSVWEKEKEICIMSSIFSASVGFCLRRGEESCGD